MKRFCLLCVLFLNIAVIAVAQRSSDKFRYGNFQCEVTSATTVKVAGIETRRPDRPRPFTYYYEQYVIPSTVTTEDGKTYTVTEIGEEAFVLNGQGEFSVVVPSTVKRIGKRAFYHLPIVDIQLADGLEVIEEEAFASSELKSLTIPGSVKEMGKNICEYARALEIVTINDGVTQLPEEMCFEAKNLKEVKMGNSVRKIGHRAFGGCEALTMVNWPAQLRVIASHAFEGTAVENGIFPTHLETIEEFAFDGAAIKKAILPASLKSVSEWSFHSMKTEAIEVNNANPTYASHQGILMDKKKTTILFAPLGLKGPLTLPSTLREVGEMMFLNCAIEEVTIPSSVKVPFFRSRS